MKKILSLILVAIMLISSIPSAYAIVLHCATCAGAQTNCPGCGISDVYCATCNVCTRCDYTANGGSDEPVIPEVGKTIVTLVGTEEDKGSYYEVEVPANMVPGDSIDIVVEGTWRSTERLKVTAPDKVTLYYGSQSIDIDIEFDGISQMGSDQGDSSATATLTIENASVKFGTWTGVIEYNVELVSGEETPSPDHGEVFTPIVIERTASQKIYTAAISTPNVAKWEVRISEDTILNFYYNEDLNANLLIDDSNAEIRLALSGENSSDEYQGKTFYIDEPGGTLSINFMNWSNSYLYMELYPMDSNNNYIEWADSDIYLSGDTTP